MVKMKSKRAAAHVGERRRSDAVREVFKSSTV
jgi:hypothetical protein